MPVPAGYLRECAVWFGKDVAYSRMTLDELGRPDLLLHRGDGRTLRIDDISVRGMRLAFTLAPGSHLSPLATRGMFVYFKLYDPLESSDDDILTMFLGTEIVHVERSEHAFSLGLAYATKIAPERYEKAFTFFNIRKYGVNELARWCDAISRAERAGRQAPVSPGIDLERLLDEFGHEEEGQC